MSAARDVTAECSRCGKTRNPDTDDPCPACGEQRLNHILRPDPLTQEQRIAPATITVRKVSHDRLLTAFPTWSVRTPELDEATWVTVINVLDGAKAAAAVVGLLGHRLEGGVAGLTLLLVSRKVRQKRIEAAKREADDEGSGN